VSRLQRKLPRGGSRSDRRLDDPPLSRKSSAYEVSRSTVGRGSLSWRHRAAWPGGGRGGNEDERDPENRAHEGLLSPEASVAPSRTVRGNSPGCDRRARDALRPHAAHTRGDMHLRPSSRHRGCGIRQCWYYRPAQPLEEREQLRRNKARAAGIGFCQRLCQQV
jgi:hypothetical protein